MVQTWYLHRSDNATKKFYVTNGSHKIYFGAAGYEDYTIHKNKKRRDRYDTRHAASENWNDPNSAGFWAKWILWNMPTIRGSIIDTKRRFNINIISCL